MCMLHLEKACLEQEDLFYKWINDESVRKNSLHGHFVEYSEHCKWFEEKLQNLFAEGALYGTTHLNIGQEASHF